MAGPLPCLWWKIQMYEHHRSLGKEKRMLRRCTGAWLAILVLLSFLQAATAWQIVPTARSHAATGLRIRTLDGGRSLQNAFRKCGRVGYGVSILGCRSITSSVKEWRKHDDSHRTKVAESAVDVNYGDIMGQGTYGEVFGGKLVDSGQRVVCKRAKDGVRDSADPVWELMHNVGLDDILRDGKYALAYKYLSTEAYINDLVMDTRPEIMPRYLGRCDRKGKRWLYWEFVDSVTLEDLFVTAHEQGSLRCFAEAFELDVSGDDAAVAAATVSEVARQLLSACAALVEAGVAHRDLKPQNLLVSKGQLLVIDFGSAAAMATPGREGYEASKTPYDQRYAPPEGFIDEEAWGSWDAYSAAMILVRLLFPPLRGAEAYDTFTVDFSSGGRDIDGWVQAVLDKDPTIKEGLDLLEGGECGVGWEVVRGLLARDPRARMEAATARSRLGSA